MSVQNLGGNDLHYESNFTTKIREFTASINDEMGELPFSSSPKNQLRASKKRILLLRTTAISKGVFHSQAFHQITLIKLPNLLVFLGPNISTFPTPTKKQVWRSENNFQFSISLWALRPWYARMLGSKIWCRNFGQFRCSVSTARPQRLMHSDINFNSRIMDDCAYGAVHIAFFSSVHFSKCSLFVHFRPPKLGREIRMKFPQVANVFFFSRN